VWSDGDLWVGPEWTIDWKWFLLKDIEDGVTDPTLAVIRRKTGQQEI